jgi:hypothetical protein
VTVNEARTFSSNFDLWCGNKANCRNFIRFCRNAGRWISGCRVELAHPST